MLLILWMMLMHTAFPHVHHEHEEHTHHGAQASHSHDHHHGHEQESEEKKSLIDLFFQNHTHSNHLPQTITVDYDKSDLIKKEQRKIVEVTASSNQDLPIPPNLEPEKPKNQEDPDLDPPFFTCNSLRGPPALG
ncbi:MAG: hypothetical protein KGZ81_10025 [Flavobacteriales bacterium]|nr:hypothetical protein [Flavobacteriales bacterium]